MRTRNEEEEIREEEENERAYVMRDFRNRSALPTRIATQEARYMRVLDLRGGDCDNVWIDRLTGKEVMRYDAADPANTDPYYGAEADGDLLRRKGCDISELIDITQAKVSLNDYDDWSSTIDDYWE